VNGKSPEERIEELEKWRTVVEATQGTMKLRAAHVALAWAVIAATCGAAIGGLYTGWQTRENAASLTAISTKLDAHMMQPGHAVSLDRIAQLQRTMDEVKNLLERYMDRGPR